MTFSSLISVIIPTIGRGSLDRVLAALSGQLRPGPFEVIVVVDGGTAWPLPAERHPDCLRMVSTAVPQRSGVSVARNLGVSQAKGEVLGFLDDDTLPAPDWLATTRAVMGRGEVDAAVGRIRETAASPLGRLRAIAYDHRHVQNMRCEPIGRATSPSDGAAARLTAVDYLSGGNCCIAADAFRACRGFDEAYLVGQDRELALRLLARGHRIAYAPDLIIDHCTRSTVRGMVRGRFASGRSAAAMRGHEPRRISAIAPEAYGRGLGALLRSHGPSVAALAALSVAAYQLGYVLPNRAGRPTGHGAAAVNSFKGATEAMNDLSTTSLDDRLASRAGRAPQSTVADSTPERRS